MGLRNGFRPTITIDEDLQETIEQAQAEQYAVVVKPPEESSKDPREAAEEVYQAIHGELDSLSFEIHQTRDGRIELRTITSSFDAAVIMKNRIMAEVQGAAVEIGPASLTIDAGEMVAGARLEYAKDHLLPLRTAKSHNVSDDPYSQVFETLAEEPDSRAVIQFVLTPVTYSRPFRWGYRLLQLWDERIETTWTSRWSRWPSPALMTNRRRRKRSLTVASLFSLIMYAGWVGLGGNPVAALPSVQLLDTILPSELGPVTIPAQFSTPLFGAASPIDPVGQFTYVVMMLIASCLYLVALFGDGLHRPKRKTAKTEGDRVRSTGGKMDRQTSRAEKRTGEAIQRQGRDLGYRVNARIITIGEDAQRVSAYRESLIRQFSNSWRNSASKQRLRGTVMGRCGHVHHGLGRFITRVAQRESTRTRWFWIQKLLVQGQRRKPIYMAPFEVASLAHWPVESRGGTAAIEYTVGSDTEQLLDGEGEGDESLEDSEPEVLPDAELHTNGDGSPPSESSPDGSEPVSDDPTEDSEPEPVPSQSYD